jgi:hypothetical protein|tara:strand:+ start:2047 stop:2226 length:180 start_codon:yes stop_codon:yes gene_type:complete
MSEMSRIIRSQCEKRVQDSAVEDPIGKRDPVRSIDYVRVSKLKIVVDGETIYEYGREEE